MVMGSFGDVLLLVAKLSKDLLILGRGIGCGKYLIPKEREEIDVHCPGAALMGIVSDHVKPGNRIR